MLTDRDFMSYVATLPEHRPVALLASTSDTFPPDMPFYSGIMGRMAHEVPAANILHNVNNIKHNMTLYLNYPPSEIELGMVWRAGEIKNVYFVRSHNPLSLGQYSIDQDGYKIVSPCELTDIDMIDLQTQVEMEREDPRLAFAMSSLNTFSNRKVSENTMSALGRGIGENSAIPEAILDMRDERKTNEDFMRIAIALVDRGWNSRDAITKPNDRVAGNNIGAIMVDRNNKIIGWGLNLKSENKTFHAETLMIQKYLKDNNTNKLPDGVRIFTSLECCHMCSAHITTLGKDVKVIYAQKDPYFNGENTLARGLNGCTQERTSLHFPDVFKSAIEEGQDILDFLFSKNAKNIFCKGYQDAALFLELTEAVLNRRYAKNPDLVSSITANPSPIMQYGEQFLEALGDYTYSLKDSISPVFFRSRSVTPSIPETSQSRTPNSHASPNAGSSPIVGQSPRTSPKLNER